MSYVQNPTVESKSDLYNDQNQAAPLKKGSIELNIRPHPVKSDAKHKPQFSPNPEKGKPGILSLLHFFFVVKLVRFINGLKDNAPSEDDLKSLVYTKTCQPLETLFTQYYYDLRTKYQGQIKLVPMVIYKVFKKEIFIQFGWQMLYVISKILEPYFLYRTLLSLRNPHKPLWNAYTNAIGMFIFFLVETYAFHQFSYNINFTANGVKLGLMGMLFRKINKISLFSMQKLSFGKLLNIVSTDTNNIDSMHNILFILLLPLTYGGAIGLLCYWWGSVGLVPVAYLICVNLFQFYMAGYIQGPGKQRTFLLDERIRMMNEILEGMRVIKLQSWEPFVIKKVSEVRKREITELRHIFSLFSLLRAVTWSSQYVSAFLLLVSYKEVNGPITAAVVFPTIILLGSLKVLGGIYGLLGIVGNLFLMTISIRTMTIMDLPEVPPHKEPRPPTSLDNSIEFQDFSGYWTKKDMGAPPFLKPPPAVPPKNLPPPMASVSPTPAVANINLNVKTGELVAVTGHTGSGKSSLLMSFTREMMKTEGELRYTGTLEYVSQDPLILAVSIRDGIAYGKPYDDELFWKVIEACQLKDFVQSLPKKEFSEMAERGVNLSNAQKTQFALARALYTKADIYLLDDPFSSFTPRLGKLIFKKAIQEFLRDSTVVLVTHNLDFVKHANRIVIMKSGGIIAQGTYSELAQQKETGVVYIDELRRRVKYEKKDLESFGQGREYDEVESPLLTKRGGGSKSKPSHDLPIDLVEDDDGLFIENERLDDGNVTLKIYWRYFRTIVSWWSIIPFIILFCCPEAVGWQFMLRLSDWLLGMYSNSEAYGILAAMAFGSMIIYAVKYLLYYACGLNGARILHNKMLRGMLHSPFKFFVTNRVGRILNRFANDVTQLDRFILNAFVDICEGFCFFMIYMIALWVHTPWILIPAGIAFVGFVITFLYFRKPINMARGLELTVRGPMYSFFSNVMHGITAFRARDQTENIMKALDYITQLTVIGTFCFLIHEKGNTIVTGPFLNMLISLPVTMQWLLKNFTNFHALMASIARIINYAENYRGIEMEKPGDANLRKSGWPHGGEIDIRHATMRYGEHKPAFIKDLNVYVKAGEKIAIVGDDSFGMTSIVNILSRVLHLDPKADSYVTIDGVNIEDMGATLLRRSMMIIQAPHLWTGTIRENLDMYKNYTDAEIWEALRLVGLKEYVEGLDSKLEAYHIKGSSLFSAGQKQLLCLARSLLRKDINIVIQDRAMTHIDIVTEFQVVKNLKERYANATVLTTTYRLWHIAGFDKVLCMKDGVKMEFDEPYRLLVKEIGDNEITNKTGYFAGLVLEMNPKIVKQTFKLAKMSYYKKHNMQLDEKYIPEWPCEDVDTGIEEGVANLTLTRTPSALEEVERNCLY